jgi:hypothetical protein
MGSDSEANGPESALRGTLEATARPDERYIVSLGRQGTAPAKGAFVA